MLLKHNPFFRSVIIQSMTVIKWQGVNRFIHFVSEQWLSDGVWGMHSARILIRAYLQTQRKRLRWRLWLVCQHNKKLISYFFYRLVIFDREHNRCKKVKKKIIPQKAQKLSKKKGGGDCYTLFKKRQWVFA